MEPTASPQPIRKLYRSRSQRQLGGVAGGLAEYTGTDPALARVLFVVLAVMGPGLLLYPLMWLVIPEESPAVAPPPAPGPGGAAQPA